MWGAKKGLPFRRKNIFNNSFISENSAKSTPNLNNEPVTRFRHIYAQILDI